MMKFKTINHEGINYYNLGSSKTINMTYDVVTANNYSEVNDFNCFTVKNTMDTIDALECEVMEYVASSKLNEEILRDIKSIEGITLDEAIDIVSKIDREKSIRESYILANYNDLDVEGNLLNIYAIDGECISIDFRKGDTLGSIVG